MYSVVPAQSEPRGVNRVCEDFSLLCSSLSQLFEFDTLYNLSHLCHTLYNLSYLTRPYFQVQFSWSLAVSPIAIPPDLPNATVWIKFFDPIWTAIYLHLRDNIHPILLF